MEPLIVTLDGPAGSGKSTVARRLAKRIGLEFLDTGAMYRGLTAKCLDRGIDPATEPEAVAELARYCPMRFDWQSDPPRLHVGDHDMTNRLRDTDVTEHVSEVAAMGPVRQVLVEHQRRIGRQHPRLVTEGRDQGSVVFPTARVKFFIDATPQVRAHRRALELKEAGRQADEQQILEHILDRDQRDSNRKDGPLICPRDADRIDTTHMSLDEVVDELERRVRRDVGHLLEPHTSGQVSGGGGQG